MINLTPEMIEKAKVAKGAEELLAIAKENNIELTEEEAKTWFEQLSTKARELSDDALNVVSGGTETNEEQDDEDNQAHEWVPIGL